MKSAERASADLVGQELDYQMYCHACKATGQAPSRDTFDQGYAEGRFRFSEDKALLADLLETYRVNVQYLAESWLASNLVSSAWGETPSEAVCRLILKLRA
ncbi:MAG TPA: hypothetical protein VM553_12700 [Dongiaceae bacterium]|nr:hypothetical protein [Dongiaceae bacterium]